MADESPRNDLEYLLEDDAPSGHGWLFVVLLLLAVTAVFLGWHWHRDGYPWSRSSSQMASNNAPVEAPTSPTSADNPTSAAPSGAAVPADNSPAAAPPAAAGADHSAAASGTVGSDKVDPGPPPAPQSSDASKPTPPQVQGAETKAAESPSPKAQAVENSSANQNAPQSSADSDSDTSAGKQGEPSPQPASAKKVVPASKFAAAQSTNPSATADDALVAEGEKYLYGNGVPQSCARAQKDLFTAAQRSNPKAQSVLGAMYATGHCVNRDLPAAYRWFAKALHEQPGNQRIAQDLEVLWKQMTPAERQAASHSEQ